MNLLPLYSYGQLCVDLPHKSSRPPRLFYTDFGLCIFCFNILAQSLQVVVFYFITKVTKPSRPDPIPLHLQIGNLSTSFRGIMIICLTGS